MKNLKYYITSIIIVAVSLQIQSDEKSDKIECYKSRYKVKCASEKIVDNYGNGFDDLYGTRNVRTILYGVAYRGGANNYYHKTNKRDNHNPLLDDGLKNLKKEGFSSAVYLYKKNWDTAPKYYYDKSNNDTLYYYQNLLSNRNQIKKLLLMVKDIIDNNKGPIYLHCWNGWHQSGYASSMILMQFCKISNEEALKYWLKNTDGVNTGYDHIKKLITDFKPFKDISITDSIQNKICPCLK